MSNKTYEFTPKGQRYPSQEFTYKYLERDPEENPELKELLQDAMDFNKVWSITIDQEHYDYLAKELHFSEPCDDHRVNYYYDLSQGTFSLINKPNGFPQLVFWIDDENDLSYQIIKKIARGNSITIREGLRYILDPNHGGSLDQTVIQIASLIIYG